jgi:hypothetical protein
VGLIGQTSGEVVTAAEGMGDFGVYQKRQLSDNFLPLCDGASRAIGRSVQAIADVLFLVCY